MQLMRCVWSHLNFELLSITTNAWTSAANTRSIKLKQSQEFGSARPHADPSLTGVVSSQTADSLGHRTFMTLILTQKRNPATTYTSTPCTVMFMYM